MPPSLRDWPAVLTDSRLQNAPMPNTMACAASRIQAATGENEDSTRVTASTTVVIQARIAHVAARWNGRA